MSLDMPQENQIIPSLLKLLYDRLIVNDESKVSLDMSDENEIIPLFPMLLEDRSIVKD